MDILFDLFTILKIEFNTLKIEFARMGINSLSWLRRILFQANFLRSSNLVDRAITEIIRWGDRLISNLKE